MVGLRFTVAEVSKYERTKKQSFMKLYEDMMQSLNGLAEAISLGMRVDIEKALDIIQEELDNGADIVNIQEEVLEALAKAGFQRGVAKEALRVLRTELLPMLEEKEA